MPTNRHYYPTEYYIERSKKIRAYEKKLEAMGCSYNKILSCVHRKFHR